jgi:hypothetical protein
VVRGRNPTAAEHCRPGPGGRQAPFANGTADRCVGAADRLDLSRGAPARTAGQGVPVQEAEGRLVGIGDGHRGHGVGLGAQDERASPTRRGRICPDLSAFFSRLSGDSLPQALPGSGRCEYRRDALRDSGRTGLLFSVMAGPCGRPGPWFVRVGGGRRQVVRDGQAQGRTPRSRPLPLPAAMLCRARFRYPAHGHPRQLSPAYAPKRGSVRKFGKRVARACPGFYPRPCQI